MNTAVILKMLAEQVFYQDKQAMVAYKEGLIKGLWDVPTPEINISLMSLSAEEEEAFVKNFARILHERHEGADIGYHFIGRHNEYLVISDNQV